MDEGTWIREQRAKWQRVMNSLDEQRRDIENRFQEAEEYFHVYEVAVREWEAEHPTDSERSSDSSSPESRREGDSLPTYLPELRELKSSSERLEALARMNGGHLYIRDVIKVWQDTFDRKSSNLSGHIYHLLKQGHRWRFVENGHYVLLEVSEGRRTGQR